MNQVNQLCAYLTNQMNEKHGFPKDVARQMVSRWLKSIKSVRSSSGLGAGYPSEAVIPSDWIKPSQPRLSRMPKPIVDTQSDDKSQ